jgi:hypothetical protein
LEASRFNSTPLGILEGSSLVKCFGLKKLPPLKGVRGLFSGGKDWEKSQFDIYPTYTPSKGFVWPLGIFFCSPVSLKIQL